MYHSHYLLQSNLQNYNFYCPHLFNRFPPILIPIIFNQHLQCSYLLFFISCSYYVFIKDFDSILHLLFPGTTRLFLKAPLVLYYYFCFLLLLQIFFSLLSFCFLFWKYWWIYQINVSFFSMGCFLIFFAL
jgi:hypothetical protein